MEQPLVSVVIPTFNRGKCIADTIKSVANQTYSNFEIIVIDDCSTDNTKEIINSLCYQNVRYFCLEHNSGAQVARNKGIKEAKGEWIAFLDSDDLWDATKLMSQMKVAQQHDFKKHIVIHSDCIISSEQGRIKKVWNMPITNGYAYDLLLSRPSTLFPSILTSKQSLELIGLLDEEVVAYQEWDTSIQLAKICEFIHIQEPLFTYTQHQDETISKNKYKEILGYYYIINKYRAEIIKNSGSIWKEHIFILLKKCLVHNIKDMVSDLIAQLELSKTRHLLFSLIWQINCPVRFKFKILKAII